MMMCWGVRSILCVAGITLGMSAGAGCDRASNGGGANAGDASIALSELPDSFYIPTDAEDEYTDVINIANFDGLIFVNYRLKGAAPADEFFGGLEEHLRPGGWQQIPYEVRSPYRETKWRTLGGRDSDKMQRWCAYVSPSGELLEVRVFFFENPPQGELPLNVSLTLYRQSEAAKVLGAYAKHRPLPDNIPLKIGDEE